MADEHRIKDCGDLDERLTPYVDGEDAPATRRAVAAHLTACPPCQAHAEAESSARDVVHEHRHDLRGQAPASLRSRCASLPAVAGVQSSAARPAQSALIRRWVPLSLAATLVLAVAGVFLFGLNNPVEALAASLAIDHVKCFAVGADHGADATEAARAWEQKRGWPIVVPKPLPAEQLTLVDVRHCLSSDGRSAHLMYTWRGSPLSLYVLPEDSGHAGTMSKMGHDAVIWCANRRTYAVVADGHPRDLARIVDYMKANAR